MGCSVYTTKVNKNYYKALILLFKKKIFVHIGLSLKGDNDSIAGCFMRASEVFGVLVCHFSFPAEKEQCSANKSMVSSWDKE